MNTNKNRPNADEMLNKKFEELFNTSTTESDSLPSPLLAMMEKIKIEKYTEALEKIAVKMKEQKLSIPSRQELFEQNLHHFDMDYAITMGSKFPLEGKHFTWVNPPKVKTLAYRVMRIVDVETRTQYYNTEFLPYAEIADEKGLQQVFFVDEPNDEEQIVFLSFFSDKDTEEVYGYVNMGILSNSSVKLARKPGFFNFDKLYSNDGEFISLSTHKEVDPNYKNDLETWWDAKLDAKIVIIDPMICEPVLREMYYDKEDEKWKSKIKLRNNKSYFAFEIRNKTDGADANFRKLTALEQGIYYRFGVWDFPKNKMLAVQYLTEDNSPEAWYHISGILFEKGEFYNESLALEYLEKSAFAGWHAAEVDLAIWYYFNDQELLPSAAKLIKSGIDTHFPPALHIAAYAYEVGIFVEKNLNIAFDFYLTAAKANFAPSIQRLSSAVAIDAVQHEELLNRYFIDSIKEETHYERYCLGRVLLGKVYINKNMDGTEYNSEFCLFINRSQGAKLIIDAAHYGCVDACFDAAKILDTGMYGVIPDKEQALKFYSLISDHSLAITVKVANWLLDGVGCEQSDDNDKRAFSLLSDLAKAENCLHVVFNNIGWMYKEGRGCNVNFDVSKQYFEKAIELGSGSSCYHLATLYEEGKICNIDSREINKKIIELLQLGAERENKKCEKRVAELRSSETIKDDEMDFTESAVDLQETLNIMHTQIIDIQKKVTNVDLRTESIQAELQDLMHYIVDDLAQMLRRAKTELQNDIAGLADEIQIEQLTAKCMADIALRINERISASGDLVEEERKHLIALFGDRWNKLLPSSQISLISAGVLWKSCDSIQDNVDFDFSGICISVTSALEAEVKRYFFDGFQQYLIRKYGKPNAYKWEDSFSYWPDELLKMSKSHYEKKRSITGKLPFIELKNPKKITLGDIPYLFGVCISEDSSDENGQKAQRLSVLRNRLNEYLSTITVFTGSEPIKQFIDNDSGNSFVHRCNFVRTMYRNPAAHTDVVTKDKARECYQEIVGNIESYKRPSDITSLLMELVSKIK